MHIQLVCLGNICRSPMGEHIFRAQLAHVPLEGIEVSSRGTGGWHEGQPAHALTREVLQAAGYSGENHRAHQITEHDLQTVDLFLAADRSNQNALRAMGAKNVRLLSEFDLESTDPDIYDPYYDDVDVFAEVLKRVERCCAELVKQLRDGKLV